jgi:predicted dienelactone hydrolase
MQHQLRIRQLCALCVLCVAIPPAFSDDAKAAPLEVAIARGEWKDSAREDRAVPYKIFAPKNIADGTKLPVIIFSHGLGGSREGYAYLGESWAQSGYVSVHLTHQGSDTAAVVGGAIKNGNALDAAQNAAFDLNNSVNRIRDVSFAIDKLAEMNKDAPWKGKLDLDRIGMAGHSFGGSTTMLLIGQQPGIALAGNLLKDVKVDPRIKAAIPMSAPAALGRDLDKAYGSISVPTLMMTGTLDDSPIGPGTLAKDRKAPFEHMPHSDRYLLIFEGGDHMVFSGIKRGPGQPGAVRAGKLPGTHGDPAKDALFQKLIVDASTAFWNATLKGNADAKKYLDDGGFEKTLGKDGEFSHKALAK